MSRLDKRKALRKIARQFMKDKDIKGHFKDVYKGIVIGQKYRESREDK